MPQLCRPYVDRNQEQQQYSALVSVVILHELLEEEGSRSPAVTTHMPRPIVCARRVTCYCMQGLCMQGNVLLRCAPVPWATFLGPRLRCVQCNNCRSRIILGHGCNIGNGPYRLSPFSEHAWIRAALPPRWQSASGREEVRQCIMPSTHSSAWY